MVCKDRRNRRVFCFGGGGGGDGGGGGEEFEDADVLLGGVVGGIGLAPVDAGGIDVGGAV